METKTEVAAKKKVGLKNCLNCVYSVPEFRRGNLVLKCSLTDRVVSPGMLWCFYGKRDIR